MERHSGFDYAEAEPRTCRRVHLVAMALATAAAVVAIPATSRADTTLNGTTAQPQSPTSTYSVPSAEATAEDVYPNRSLIATGLVTFGLSYGSAAIVGATSEHRGDDHLLIPVAGPWLDIADRGMCGYGTEQNCDTENANKVLLGIDGVFQGLGALAFLAGFLVPEEHTVYTPVEQGKIKVHVAPASYGRGSPGVSLFGTF